MRGGSLLVFVIVLAGVVEAEFPPVAHGSIPLKRGIDSDHDAAGDDSSETSFAQMTNYRNTQYTGTVHVGTPPQPFNVILDTGSANFWVYSEECNSPACRSHARFDSTHSDTFSTNRTTFFVKYGSGRINGILAQDNVQLGSLVVPQQVFGVVTKETGSAFVWGKYDGILGLAFPSLAIEGSQPILDTIIQQGLVTPMFSFYFSSSKSDSAFFVGGVPPSYANHEYNWHHVIRKGYWEIGLDDVLIDSTSLAACPHHNNANYQQKYNMKLQSMAAAKAGFGQSGDVYENVDLGNSRGSDVDEDDSQMVMSEDDVEEGFISELESGESLQVQEGMWMATSVSSVATVCVRATAGTSMQMKHSLQSQMCSQMSSMHQSQPMMKFPENDAAYNSDKRCKAAIDTGTSLITGPSEAINKLQALMGQVSNCDDLSNMPTVTFVIDGVKYPLTPEQYVLQFEAEDGQPASCLLGFKALDVPPPRGPLWVVGDVFMRAYFSVFDRSENRIGFTVANVKPTDPTDPTPAHGPSLPIGIDTDKDDSPLPTSGDANGPPSSSSVSTMSTSVPAVSDTVGSDAPQPTSPSSGTTTELHPAENDVSQPVDFERRSDSDVSTTTTTVEVVGDADPSVPEASPAQTHHHHHKTHVTRKSPVTKALRPMKVQSLLAQDDNADDDDFWQHY